MRTPFCLLLALLLLGIDVNAAVPIPPTGLSASGNNAAINLAWSPVSGATTYSVKRSLWNGGPMTTVVTGLNALAYTDSGLLNGSTYYYTVTASNVDGESLASIEVWATPTATAAASTLPYLHPLFSNNAVLQRDAIFPVWGWTTPGASVTVNLHGQTATTNAAATGRWQVNLGPFAADGASYSLTVTGPQSATVTNLVFGDVFVFSGQSNMERQLGPRPPQQDIYNYQAEAAAANYPNIRSFYVPEVQSGQPQISLSNAAWSVCNPTNVLNITAVGYFTTRALHLAETVPGPNNTTINVPMGILFTAWGGTRIEVWLETQEAAAIPELVAAVNGSPASVSSTTASTMYNQMIAPLAPFRIKGAVWYQGENSADRSAQYHRLLPALMSGWRRVFSQSNLPFVIVQLPNWNGATTWPELREAQLATVQTDLFSRLSTGTDIGEAGDIHPKDKQDVGTRVARAMRDVAYGETLVSQGPLFTGATVSGNTIRCAFSNVGSGLMVGSKTIVQNPDSSYTINPVTEVVGGTLTGFTIAGADKNFVAATAAIDSATNTVLVSAASFATPLYVRYAWLNNPACNLYNKITNGNGNVVDGLPASPFRNDPVYTLNVLNGSGSGAYGSGTNVPITANSVANLTFKFWSGDTSVLANSNNSSTTATVSRRYQTVGSTYQLNTAPTGLAATPGSQQITLNWTALNNAIAYNVKRATTSGGPYTTLATGLLGTSYVDTTSSFNSTRYYIISASNAAGESPNSSQISSAGQPPSAPANLTASVGSTVVGLTWGAVANADSYTLSRSTVSGGPYAPLITVAGNSYVNTGLNNGTTYYYVVNGIINGAVTPTSTAISATPTSSTAPINRARGGTASGTINHTTTAQYPAAAFDGALNTKWYTVIAAVNASSPAILQYQFSAGAAWTVSSYQLGIANDVPARDPRDWQFQGSNDGTAWTTLNTQTNQNQTPSPTRSAYTTAYTVASPAAYRYYRLLVTAAVGSSGNGCQLSELALFSSSSDAGDKTPPVINTPANISVEATNSSGAVVNFTVTATDNVSASVTPVVAPASGSVFPAGTTTVQTSATDQAGNSASKSFTIKVAGYITSDQLVGPPITLADGNVTIHLNTVAGRVYQLERSYTLDATSWVPVNSAQNGGGQLIFTDTPDSVTKAFYRVRIDP